MTGVAKPVDPAEPNWQAFVDAIHDLNTADLDDRATVGSIQARRDQGEADLCSTVATTLAGAAAPLWVALHQMVTTDRLEAIMVARNMPALEEVEEELDWPARLIVAALRSLHAQEGR